MKRELSVIARSCFVLENKLTASGHSDLCLQIENRELYSHWIILKMSIAGLLYKKKLQSL